MEPEGAVIVIFAAAGPANEIVDAPVALIVLAVPKLTVAVLKLMAPPPLTCWLVFAITVTAPAPL